MDRRVDTDAGFSLIELVISIAILSVMAVGVSLVASRTSSPAARDRSLFQTQFELHRTEALHDQRRRGLEVSVLGLRSANYSGDRWHHAETRHRWQGSASIFTHDPVVGAPEVIFLGSGQNSRFDIRFSDGVTCRSDGWTGLKCD